ncbi:MAG TPA: hypothetical protein VF526_22340, partial [Solirubrobacteraceae bacterium]
RTAQRSTAADSAASSPKRLCSRGRPNWVQIPLNPLPQLERLSQRLKALLRERCHPYARVVLVGGHRHEASRLDQLEVAGEHRAIQAERLRQSA